MKKTPEKTYSADNKGLRFDEGKPQFHLFPADGLAEIGHVCTLGAKKYAPYNWERGMEWSRIYNSLMRHTFAFWNGETHDAETGRHHMAHAAWNAIALLVYSLRGIGIDDRKTAMLVEEQNRQAQNTVLRAGESIHDLYDRDHPPISDMAKEFWKGRKDAEMCAFASPSYEERDQYIGLKRDTETVMVAYHDQDGQPLIEPEKGMQFEDKDGARWEVVNVFSNGNFFAVCTKGDRTSQMMTPRSIYLAILQESPKATHRCMHCPNDARPDSALCAECEDPQL